jgi:hypothetical protein
MTNATVRPVHDIQSHLLANIKDLHDLINLPATSPLERAIYELALAQDVAALDQFDKDEDMKKLHGGEGDEEEKAEETGTGYNDMVVISSYPTTNKPEVPVDSLDDSQTGTTIMVTSSDDDDSSTEDNNDDDLASPPPAGPAREQLAV